jgi:hypothetical protein
MYKAQVIKTIFHEVEQKIIQFLCQEGQGPVGEGEIRAAATGKTEAGTDRKGPTGARTRGQATARATQVNYQKH